MDYNIVRSIIWDAIQEKKTRYPDPTDYDIKIDKDLENIRHRKPYWWRVLSTVWYSASEINQLVLLFKARFLTPASISTVSGPKHIHLKDSRYRKFLAKLGLRRD